MNTDRLFNSVVNFGLGLGFVLAYAVARLVRDYRTGVRAGFVVGVLTVVAGWVLRDRHGDTIDEAGAVAEGVVVPVEGPAAGT